jgi:hypothetical protein
LLSMAGAVYATEPAAERTRSASLAEWIGTAGGRISVEVGRRSVEADEGVEVDDAAPLVLGDLGKLHPQQPPGRGLCNAQVAGDLPV